MSKIYNVGAFGIPEKIVTQARSARLKLTYSRHAIFALTDDKYGEVTDPGVDFNGSQWTLVEAETIDTPAGELATKFIVRRKIDETRSLVLVILPEGKLSPLGFVKTAWINLNTDNHRTLDKTKVNFSRP